eukprot:scaffold34819_cov147-Isochrysis_galbana.AAC.1
MSMLPSVVFLVTIGDRRPAAAVHRHGQARLPAQHEAQRGGMQESTLTALHHDLESKVHARGGSGGLGFNAADAKAARQAEKKVNKRLRGAGDSHREFSSTSSGAVAAGHWDPWARPVEFKMRAKNTTVGGLYSMFVRGGTMGGTLKDAQAATPVTAPGTEGDGQGKKKKQKAEKQERKQAEKQEKKKEGRRKEHSGVDVAATARAKSGKAAEREAGTHGAKGGATVAVVQAVTSQSVTFDWEADILRRLCQVGAVSLAVLFPAGGRLFLLPLWRSFHGSARRPLTLFGLF